jgi:hypothetical protein
MAGWCCMCRRDWETGDHLLLHCTQARDVWYSVLNYLGAP